MAKNLSILGLVVAAILAGSAVNAGEKAAGDMDCPCRNNRGMDKAKQVRTSSGASNKASGQSSSSGAAVRK
jgi:hypothetical protein